MRHFLPSFVFLPESACFSLLSEFSGSCFYILHTVRDGYFQEVGLLSDKTEVCVRNKLRVTIFDPMDCSLPGSSVRGILHVRILEWIATSFSRISS